MKSHGLDAQQKEVWKKNFMLSSEEEKHLKTLPPKNQTGKCVYLEKEVDNYVCKVILMKSFDKKIRTPNSQGEIVSSFELKNFLSPCCIIYLPSFSRFLGITSESLTSLNLKV